MNRDRVEELVGVRLNSSNDTAYIMWGEVKTVSVPVYEDIAVSLFGGLVGLLDVLFNLAVEQLVGEANVDEWYLKSMFWSMSLVTERDETSCECGGVCLMNPSDEEIDYCDTVQFALMDFYDAVCQAEDESESLDFKYHIFYDNNTVFIVQGDTDAFEAYEQIASCDHLQHVTVRGVDG